MCNCNERDYGQVDIRQLQMDGETRMRLTRYRTVNVRRTKDGVEIEADGHTVTAKDGPTALRELAGLEAMV